MKLKLLYLFFIIIGSISLSAQKGQVSIGPSLPIGIFSNDSLMRGFNAPGVLDFNGRRKIDEYSAAKFP